MRMITCTQVVNCSSDGHGKITFHFFQCTVKPVLRGHSKIDKTKVLKTNGSLMKVVSIAECSLHSAMLLTCIKR